MLTAARMKLSGTAAHRSLLMDRRCFCHEPRGLSQALSRRAGRGDSDLSTSENQPFTAGSAQDPGVHSQPRVPSTGQIRGSPLCPSALVKGHWAETDAPTLSEAGREEGLLAKLVRVRQNDTGACGVADSHGAGQSRSWDSVPSVLCCHTHSRHPGTWPTSLICPSHRTAWPVPFSRFLPPTWHLSNPSYKDAPFVFSVFRFGFEPLCCRFIII